MQGKVLRQFDTQEKDNVLIQNFDSLLKVIHLTYATCNWWLRLFCIVWVSPLAYIQKLYLAHGTVRCVLAVIYAEPTFHLLFLPSFQD